jgi:hypothetical protein
MSIYLLSIFLYMYRKNKPGWWLFARVDIRWPRIWSDWALQMFSFCPGEEGISTVYTQYRTSRTAGDYL